MVNRLKQMRCITTHYDMSALSVVSFLNLAAVNQIFRRRDLVNFRYDHIFRSWLAFVIWMIDAGRQNNFRLCNILIGYLG